MYTVYKINFPQQFCCPKYRQLFALLNRKYRNLVMGVLSFISIVMRSFFPICSTSSPMV